MASPKEHTSSVDVVCLADDLDAPFDPAGNRRTHERLKPGDVSWLKGARVKYGPDVHVIDISAGGVLLETENALTQNSNIVLELTGGASPIVLPSKVLRCRIASLGEILRYQGACAFRKPLPLGDVRKPAQSSVEEAVRRSIARDTQAASAASWQKVIARYRDGRMVSGFTNDFHPSKPQLHVSANPRHGNSTLIPIVQLKALFFVREFTGDPTRVERKDFVDPPQGRKIEITFHDNEVLVGSTLGYRREGHGFFVQPADAGSNNLRVFVTTAGMRHARFL
jgi:hypothetical protein